MKKIIAYALLLLIIVVLIGKVHITMSLLPLALGIILGAIVIEKVL